MEMTIIGKNKDCPVAGYQISYTVDKNISDDGITFSWDSVNKFLTILALKGDPAFEIITDGFKNNQWLYIANTTSNPITNMWLRGKNHSHCSPCGNVSANAWYQCQYIDSGNNHMWSGLDFIRPYAVYVCNSSNECVSTTDPPSGKYYSTEEECKATCTPPPTTTPSPTTTPEKKYQNVWWIGLVVAVLLLVVIIIVMLMLRHKKKNKQRNQKK